MSSKKNIILEFYQYWRSDKVTGIIYKDLESFQKKLDEPKNNPKKLSARKANEHIPSRSPISTIWSFDDIENKHEVYRSKDLIKTFFESLKEHVINIINLDKKQMIPLTNKEQESYGNQEICHFYNKML